MCVVFLALKQHPQYPLILLSNRDEFYQRPARVAQFWTDEYPDILAGKDLQNGGTWLGITRSGHLSLLTNFRDPQEVKTSPPSRGLLVLDYLRHQPSLAEYTEKLKAERSLYPGYNLIFGQYPDFSCYSNRTNQSDSLRFGYFGLSNHFLNTPWPKLTRGIELFRQQIQTASSLSIDTFFSLMNDSQIAPDSLLPETGIGLEKERLLSSIFIRSSRYGTRATTILLIDNQSRVSFFEKTYFPTEQLVSYEFNLG